MGLFGLTVWGCSPANGGVEALGAWSPPETAPTDNKRIMNMSVQFPFIFLFSPVMSLSQLTQSRYPSTTHTQRHAPMFVSYVVLDSTNPKLLTSIFVSATFSGGNKIPEKTDSHIQEGLLILTHGCRSFHEQWAGIVLAVRRYSMAERHGRQKLQTAW